jgi:Ca2+-binding RTX toxin-like protein
MFLCDAQRILRKRVILGATALILALAAVPALAVNLSGDGTIVGTTGNDNLSAGNNNDTVWGLGGKDVISAGNGNDVIDANGKCPPGLKSGVYPNGLPSGVYCEHGQIPGSSDTISAGNGNDTIYGGGGPNTISAGRGNDTIYGGPIGDTIAVGLNSQGNDVVFLGLGPHYAGSSLATGYGDDVIHAQNGVKDTISCQRGNGTKVYADRVDSVKGCQTVIFSADPNPGPNPRPVGDARTSKHAKHHRVVKHHKVVKHKHANKRTRARR